MRKHVGTNTDETDVESPTRADEADVSPTGAGRRLAPSRRSLLRASGVLGIAMMGHPPFGRRGRAGIRQANDGDDDEGRTPQTAKLLPNDGAPYDEFGDSVAVDDESAVVGAPDTDVDGDSSGSAYVFRRRGGEWRLDTKLLPIDGQRVDDFGDSVAVAANTAVVAAVNVGDTPDSGSAYVFRHREGQWRQEATLPADEGEDYDEYDYSVAVDDETVVVGVRSDDDNGPVSGSAFVFRRRAGEWRRETKLVADDGETGDEFGYSVAVDGETVVIGAPDDADELTDVSGPGSAYVFRRRGDEWHQVTRLRADDGAPNDQFGDSVAVDGRTAVVGAVRDTADGVESGSTYVYRHRGGRWRLLTKLLPDDGKRSDFFGDSVAVAGETVVVGASGDDGGGSRSGAAYVFRRRGDEWHPAEKLRTDDGRADDRLGRSVAVDCNTVVVGAIGDDDNGTSSGSAYVWEW